MTLPYVLLCVKSLTFCWGVLFRCFHFGASFSKQLSLHNFRFGVRVHRPFQTALLFVAGSWSWQSTAAGVGGRGSWSWYLITVVPNMFLHFSNMCFLCRLSIQWHQTKNALATSLSRWCCPTSCCCCTRSPPVRRHSKQKPFVLFVTFFFIHCSVVSLD